MAPAGSTECQVEYRRHYWWTIFWQSSGKLLELSCRPVRSVPMERVASEFQLRGLPIKVQVISYQHVHFMKVYGLEGDTQAPYFDLSSIFGFRENCHWLSFVLYLKAPPGLCWRVGNYSRHHWKKQRAFETCWHSRIKCKNA